MQNNNKKKNPQNHKPKTLHKTSNYENPSKLETSLPFCSKPLTCYSRSFKYFITSEFIIYYSHPNLQFMEETGSTM